MQKILVENALCCRIQSNLVPISRARPRNHSKTLTKLLCYESYERKASKLDVAKTSNVTQVTKLDLRFRGPELILFSDLKACCEHWSERVYAILKTNFAIFAGDIFCCLLYRRSQMVHRSEREDDTHAFLSVMQFSTYGLTISKPFLCKWGVCFCSDDFWQHLVRAEINGHLVCHFNPPSLLEHDSRYPLSS